jgi:acetyl esterase/lipase
MLKCLAISLLTAIAALGGQSPIARDVIPVGLTDDPATAPGAASCDNVTFTRSVKYGGDSLNVLDVATGDNKSGGKRPVLVFVVGDSFSGEAFVAASSPVLNQAMCFAARNGLVAVSMSYRLAPAATWPSGAKDVAAALSWVHENADLFGGNGQEIIPIGYGTGAYHLASFLAHKEFQQKDDYIAGAVLLSGIYHPTADAGDAARAYLGADTSSYDSRSAIKGLTQIEEPILLAWSSADAPYFIAQGEKLKDTLCAAGHCPRFSVLSQPSSPASIFDLDGASADLHERLRQLIGQIDARGLP